MSKKPKQKIASIKNDLLFSVSTMVLMIILFLSCFSVYSIRSSTTQALEKSVKEASHLVATKIEDKISDYAAMAQILVLYTSQNNPGKTRLASFEQSLESLYQVDNVTLLTGIGTSLSDGTDYSDREAFQQALKIGSFLTDPIVSGEEVSYDFAYQEKGYVVLVTIPYSILEGMIHEVSLGETGSTYILNHAGTKVAHNDFTLVQNQQNDLEDVKKDKKTYGSIAKLETKMVNGETGFGFYTWKGTKTLGSYNPIGGTNGWSVNVTASSKEFMSSANISVLITVVFGGVGLLAAILLILRVANSIIRPVHEVVTAITQMSEGKLNINIPVHKQNEIGEIAQKINGLAISFRAMISDINYILGEMSEGNFDVHFQAENSYVGDFEDILTSIRKINHSLSDTLWKIKAAADQVALGSSQMAEGALNLAEGATDQAGAVEELSATIEDVNHKVEQSAKDTLSTSDKAQSIGQEAMESTAQMQKMTNAMEQISNASRQIANIIGTIEDIASQTNLLSLNASIEAARAGDAGKGFAVVASEIGQLAKQSSEAVEDTRKLIQASLSEVDNGSEIVTQTASSLDNVIRGISEIVTEVQKVADSAKGQTAAISQINQGVEQISAVVQANSATAEESSATSEELSSQADTLKELIEGFTLKVRTW